MVNIDGDGTEQEQVLRRAFGRVFLFLFVNVDCVLDTHA